jgi:dolichol-phosphate mannosyltransferase
MYNNYIIAVVIPAFNVKSKIFSVLDNIPAEVDQIYLVDDFCPEKTGKFVLEKKNINKLKVIFHNKNKGVGGALKTGYLLALQNRAEIIVKIDGDGQMDPKLIFKFIDPIIFKKNDYSKGNRLSNLKNFLIFPKTRLFGNLILSLIAKFSTGYWDILDPCNGYVAIKALVLKKIKIERISNDFFFETSLLFELSMIDARVIDVSMKANYLENKSNLKIYKIIPKFLYMHLFYFFKRIYYVYYYSKKTFASLVLAVGLILLSINVIIYSYHWYNLSFNKIITSTETFKILKISFILNILFLIFFIYMDIKFYFNKLIEKSSVKKRNDKKF